MIYSIQPHAVALLVLFILVSLFSVWGVMAEHKGDTVPSAFFSLICSVIGIIVVLVHT